VHRVIDDISDDRVEWRRVSGLNSMKNYLLIFLYDYQVGEGDNWRVIIN
jgi:hypothetical protein